MGGERVQLWKGCVFFVFSREEYNGRSYLTQKKKYLHGIKVSEVRK